jgi:hemoglobin/transferrin/lactoferrin receptor protein
MKKHLLSLGVFFFSFISFALSANSSRIVGTVVNGQTGELLPRANIIIVDTGFGTVSDHRGRFVLENVQAPAVLRVTYMGFESLRIQVDTPQDQAEELKIVLQPTIVPLQNVIVTSNKFAQEADQVSYPLSVVRAEAINNTAPVTLSDVLDTEPGIALARDGIWGTHVSIRGLSRSNLVTLVDGNRIDTATDNAAGMSLVDVHDIERIEVIKGAASVLYGSGATGGAVNIITRDGWYQEQFYLTGHLASSFGSVNNMGSGWLTVNAGSSRWYAKLSGSLRQADDTQTPQGVLENSQFSDDNLSARLGIRLHPNHELLFNWQRYRATDVGIPGASPLFPSQAKVSYPQEDRDLASLEYVSRNLTDQLLKLSVKVFTQDILRDVLNNPYTVQSVPAQNGQPAKRIHVLAIAPGATHKILGFQTQGDLQILPGHYLVAGLDGWEKRYEGWRTKTMRIDVLSPVDESVMKSMSQTIGELPLPNSSYRSIGFYLQDQANLWSERLLLTLGARHDWIHIENDRALNPLYQILDGVRNDSPINQIVMWEASSAQNRSWSGTASLLMRLNPANDLTLTLSRSFRSPSLEERYQYIDLGNLLKIGDPELDPEDGRFIDFGWRFRALPMALSANVFLNQLDNLVVEMPGLYENRNALLKTNIGKAQLYGIDARADFALSSHFTAYAMMAYVNGQDRDSQKPLPAIAPLNGIVGVRGSLTPVFSFEMVSYLFATQDRLANGELRTPGYAIFDLYARSKAFKIAATDTRVILGIENVLDRSYRNHLATNRGYVTAEPGRNFVVQWIMGF